jgi:S1-C subfamily serine protease
MWFVRIGSKVSGPYSEAQLRSMRQRGQFSPMHQVSTDRVRWESAAPLVQMFDAATVTDSAWAPKAAPPATTPTANNGPAKEWFYLDAARTQLGPISEAEACDLARRGAITRETLVCRTGASEWLPASNIPFLAGTLGAAPKSRMPLFWGGAVAACCLLAGGLVFALRDRSDGSGGKGNSTAQSAAAQKTAAGDPLRITSLEDESILTNAIGRTVCAEILTLPNGSVIEKPASHGTAFAITKTGYFLTNRHVVEDLAAEKTVALKSDSGLVQVKVEVVAFVFLGKLRFPAKVVHTSSRFDMAILKIDRTQPQPFFALSDQSNVNRRTEVVALGFPGLASRAMGEESKMLGERFNLQLSRALESKCTVNVETLMPESSYQYSAEDGKTSRVANDTSGTVQLFHSAKIFPGNSGGPLVSSSSTVIGINTLFRRDIDKIGDQIVTGDNIYIALAMGQMRDEITEHIPDPVVWVKD